MFRSAVYRPDAPLTADLQARYRASHHVAFPSFVSDAFFPQLKRDVEMLLERKKRREFLMQCMDNSPRRMNVVGGNTIEKFSECIPRFYQDPGVLDFLSAVVGERVLPLVDDIDRYVINQLQWSSDTFGAHYDDYPLSFVVILDSPGMDGGGYVEMVPNATSLSQLEDNPIRLALEAGDAYVLRSDTTAHRVAPLTVDVQRTAINLAYTTPGYVPRQTESAVALYGDA